MALFGSPIGEMLRIYMDTNAFIPLIEAPPTKFPKLFELMVLVGMRRALAVTSDLTFGELLVIPYAEDEALADTYFNLLNASESLILLPIDRETVVRAARLRALRKGLKLPDAIHLAAAELHACDVFLSDDRDIIPRPPMVRVGLSDDELTGLVDRLS